MISLTIAEIVALCIGVLLGRLTVYVIWDIYCDYVHIKSLKKDRFEAKTDEVVTQ